MCAIPAEQVRRARATFLVAVAVLLANDWVIKPTGILPGWASGKLSDLAGMVMAPVVLAALLALARVPVRGAALGSALAVGLGFAALKLFPAAAALYDAALARVGEVAGLPWRARTAVDPSDLLALPLLMVGAALASILARDHVPRAGAGLALGFLACAATSFSHFRVPPHWGFADRDLTSLSVYRLGEGAVLVRLGRSSNDGRFELDLQLAAERTAMAVDLEAVRAVLGDEQVPAQAGNGVSKQLRADAGQVSVARIYFAPGDRTWEPGARGTLVVPIQAGGRGETLQVPLSFEERLLPWSSGRFSDVQR
jgi:hypothetical protein